MSIDSKILKAASGQLQAFIISESTTPCTADILVVLKNHCDDIDVTTDQAIGFTHQGSQGVIFFAPKGADPQQHAARAIKTILSARRALRITELSRELAALRREEADAQAEEQG